ncbi:MAG: TraR/DksA family transcriptional regulator, partial [Flavobacteriales bacterium]
MLATSSSNGPENPQRYSAAELSEFRKLLNDKLAKAKDDLRYAKESLTRIAQNGTDDTYSGGHSMEDGSASLEREELVMLAERQEKFIVQLEHALARMRAGNYGVCRVTGKLIP